jgi:hypothetical protein
VAREAWLKIGCSHLAADRYTAGAPGGPYIREKFTREQSSAREVAREYFKYYPKDRYDTEVESWRHLQSNNYEFTMKRLREPKSP